MQARWGNEGSATVNFMRNFLALSKDVAFHPCASAQGRDGKEDEGVRGRRRKGGETVSRARALRSFLSSDINAAGSHWWGREWWSSGVVPNLSTFPPFHSSAHIATGGTPVVQVAHRMPIGESVGTRRLRADLELAIWFAF